MIGFVSTQTCVEQLQSATQTQESIFFWTMIHAICDYIIITHGNIASRNNKTCQEFCCKERWWKNSTSLGNLVTFRYYIINTNQLKSGSKAPPPHPAQKRATSFGHRTKECDRNVSKRHSFISFFQKHLHKKHMDINVVLFLSYACVNMNYLRNVGWFLIVP